MRYIRSRLLLASSAIQLGLVLGTSAHALMQDPEASGPVLHLGKIEVRGQKHIMEALQAIKLALKRPESSDASQQNVIVCRIEKDVGTHQQDTLTCATNKTLGQRRHATQNGMIAACESVRGTSCYTDQGFSANSPLNDALKSTDDHVLHMQVNEASLRALLAKIPEPAPATATAPAAGSTAAPSAATSHD